MSELDIDAIKARLEDRSGLPVFLTDGDIAKTQENKQGVYRWYFHGTWDDAGFFAEAPEDIAALIAEVELLKEAVIVEQKRRKPWVKLAHQNAQEVKRLKEQIDAVKALHRPAHAVFSWNGGTRYEDPCPECHGAPGVHPCGCWTDTQIEYVCAECHRLGMLSKGVYDYTYPCPTIHALEAA